MTTFAHKTTWTQIGKLPCFGYGIGKCLQYGWDWLILSCLAKHDTKCKEKFVALKFKRTISFFSLVVSMTCTDKLKLMIFYEFLRPRWLGSWLHTNYAWWFANQMAWWHQMYLTVRWWASMYISYLKSRGYILCGNYANHIP